MTEQDTTGPLAACGANQSNLYDLVNDWTRDPTIDEVETVLIAHGVPASKVYRAPEMLADPHFAAREAIVTLPHPRRGEVAMQNVFPKLSRTPGRRPRDRPTDRRPGQRRDLGRPARPFQRRHRRPCGQGGRLAR